MARPLAELAQLGVEAVQKGDLEGARRIADEYRAGMGSLQRSLENVDKDEASYGPQAGRSRLRSAWEGFGATLPTVGRQAIRMLTPEAMEGPVLEKVGLARPGQSGREATQEQEAIDARMGLPGKLGKLGGEIALTAPIAGTAGNLLRGTKALRAAREAQNLRSVSSALRPGMFRRGAANAAEGAFGAELTSDDSAATGAAFGLATTPAMNLFGRGARFLGRGMARTRGAQTLLNYGADLTPGQMNPEGWLARLEKGSRTAPFGAGVGIRQIHEQALEPVVPNLATRLAGGFSSPARNARKAVDAALSRIEKHQAMVDNVPLDPELARNMAAGRVRLAEAGRVGREAGADRAIRTRTGAGQKVTLAEATELEGKLRLRRARRGGVREAIRAAQKRWGVARERVAEAQVDASAIPGSLTREQAAKAGRTAIDTATTQVERELMQNTIGGVRGKLREPDVARVIEDYGRVLRENPKRMSLSDLKQAASDLKGIARSIRYKRNPNFESRQSAAILEKAAQWFENKIVRGLRTAGKDAAAYQRSNRRLASLKPLQQAVVEAGSKAGNLLPGQAIENALKRTMSSRAYVAGRGGPSRKVGEALIELEEQMGKDIGAPQQSGVVLPSLRLLQSLAGRPIVAEPVRMLAQGRTAPQRLIRKLHRRGGRYISHTLPSLLKPGVPGALASAEVQSNQER